MKIIFKVLFIALFFQQAVAQNLTVERIWRNYEFSAKGASAYQMLNDGVHFVEWSDAGALIKGDISNNAIKK